MTEKRFNARKNIDNDDFEERLKVVLEDIVGIVHSDDVTNSVELKKEYYREQSKDKHYTYLDYSRDKYIGSFFCNDVMLKTNEVVELLNEQDNEIQKIYSTLDNRIEKLKEDLEKLNDLDKTEDLHPQAVEDVAIVLSISLNALKEFKKELMGDTE